MFSERALEIVQEVFVDSLHQGKQHQDFRGFGQGRGGHRYERGWGFHRGGPPRFHQQAPHSAACHRCGKDDHWARNCILNPQHRDFRHMWRCNICRNKGHGPVRCPFHDSCQQQQNQQQQNLTQQQHQEQPKETNKQNNSNYIVADLNLFWEKGAAEREDWRGKNTENKMGEEAVLGETVLETTGEEARDETERNKEPRAEIRSKEPEEATDNAQEEPDDKRGEEKTKAQVAQHSNTNKKIAKKKNVKKRSYEVEAERWEEMKREGKVDNCRLWLPLEVEGERTLALYDTGTTRSFCNEEFIHHHNLTQRSTKWSAATQAGTLVKILGEVDIKVKSVRGQVEYTVLVVAGGRGILVLSEKDGRKLGIHVVGLLAGFPDEQAAIMDNREWVEENTVDMRKEVQASANELEEINEIVGPALDKNKKLPKSAVCNRPDAVYSFNIALDAKTWVWQYPVLAKAKQKVAKRLKEWRKNGWSKPAVPRNCNNNPLLAVNKKSAGVVAFDDIRLCIDARQLNTLNRTKKRTYMLPRIADILKKAQKVTFMADLDLKAAFHQFLLDARSSELSAFTSLCDGSRQQMTRMWFGKEGASDHCQMIVERVMGLREDGTEDWDLFVDNSYMFFTGSNIRKFMESVARLI